MRRLGALIALLDVLVSRGQSEDEIRKSLDLSIWDKLERSYVIGRNINRAYLEIEADSFELQPRP